MIAGGAVAAAALVAFVLVTDQTDNAERMEAALSSEQSPELTGTAEFTRTDSGWRIELDAPGLPRLDDGEFYQAWLRNDDDVLVAVGTFNEGNDVVLWAGVSPSTSRRSRSRESRRRRPSVQRRPSPSRPHHRRLSCET